MNALGLQIPKKASKTQIQVEIENSLNKSPELEERIRALAVTILNEGKRPKEKQPDQQQQHKHW